MQAKQFAQADQECQSILISYLVTSGSEFFPKFGEHQVVASCKHRKHGVLCRKAARQKRDKDKTIQSRHFSALFIFADKANKKHQLISKLNTLIKILSVQPIPLWHLCHALQKRLVYYVRGENPDPFQQCKIIRFLNWCTLRQGSVREAR